MPRSVVRDRAAVLVVLVVLAVPVLAVLRRRAAVVVVVVVAVAALLVIVLVALVLVALFTLVVALALAVGRDGLGLQALWGGAAALGCREPPPHQGQDRQDQQRQAEGAEHVTADHRGFPSQRVRLPR